MLRNQRLFSGKKTCEWIWKKAGICVNFTLEKDKEKVASSQQMIVQYNLELEKVVNKYKKRMGDRVRVSNRVEHHVWDKDDFSIDCFSIFAYFSSKNQPKSFQKSIPSHFRSIFPSIFLRFWLHFGGQLGAMLATLGPLGGVLAASWGPLGPSWRPLGASWRPRPTRSEGDLFFGGLLGASWPHFWEVFGWFLG